MNVPPTRPSPLGQRLDEARTARGFKDDREWCALADVSLGYLATQRNRAATHPEDREPYTLPEKFAPKLAHAAGVNVEWLRFGRGPRDVGSPSATSTAPLGPIAQTPMTREPRDAEIALAEAYARNAERFSARDFLAALELLRSREMMLPQDREAAVLAMERYLSAVARLRRDGRPITHEELINALLVYQANAEGLAELRALGGEPPREPVRTPARGLPVVPSTVEADEQSGQRPRFAPPPPRTGTR